MQFSTMISGLVAAATAANAATVTFWTLDDVQRTVYFTPSVGNAEIAPVNCDNTKNVTVTFPDNYIGNFNAVTQGQPKTDGMLGEVTFGGYAGKTFFDVSAIVNAADKNNVKQMWPKGALAPMSGCVVFPCPDAYYLPDDVQTKVTDSVDLMTTLGSGSTGLNLQATL